MHEYPFEKLFRLIKFQNILVGPGRMFPEWKHFDWNLAKSAWEKRFPQIDWGLCPHHNCSEMTPNGQFCLKHSKGDIPKWKWDGSVLYHYSSIANEMNAKSREVNDTHKYVDYGWKKAKQKFADQLYGFGYTVIHLDGNVFNYRTENIGVVSNVFKLAIDNGIVTPVEGFNLDDIMHSELKKRGIIKQEGRKPFQAFYSYGDIARACGTGVKSYTIRKKVREGVFDPYNLASVLKFVIEWKNTHN